MKNLFTKREIALLVFVLGGLGLGWAVSNFTRSIAAPFPEPEAVRAISPESAVPKISARQAPAEPRAPIDVNRAPVEELVKLPSIGPVIAGRIVEDREQNGRYEKPEDLLRVKGIGPVTLGKIEPMIVISNE